MAITTGNALLLAATLVSSQGFEDFSLGDPGLWRWWCNGDHFSYVTNVKAHDGEKSFCHVDGEKSGQMAFTYHILSCKGRQDLKDRLEKGGYIRFSFWFCPDTPNANFSTELRTDVTRPLIWDVGAGGFGLRPNYMDPAMRQLKDWKCGKACELGKWHKVEVFIPASASEGLSAKMRITWPDGTTEQGETDYNHQPQSEFSAVQIVFNSYARFFIDDYETSIVETGEAPKTVRQERE